MRRELVALLLSSCAPRKEDARRILRTFTVTNEAGFLSQILNKRDIQNIIFSSMAASEMKALLFIIFR